MFPATDFITLATAAAPGGMASMVMQFAPFILIIVVFYFLLIRPQQQRAKQHREMIENLRKGDEVVTSGGMIGKITRIADHEVTVELAPSVRVKVIKATLAEVRARTAPARGSRATKETDDEPANDDGSQEDARS